MHADLLGVSTDTELSRPEDRAGLLVVSEGRIGIEARRISDERLNGRHENGERRAIEVVGDVDSCQAS